MVSPVSATRIRAPGGSFILSEYQGVSFPAPLTPSFSVHTVISLTGTLSHARENGVSAVFRCYIGYQLLYQYGLAHTCAAKETYFSSLA